MKRECRLDAAALEGVESSTQTCRRFVSVVANREQFGQQRVVESTDDAALLYSGVDAYPVARRLHPPSYSPRHRGKQARGILSADPDFDGMTNGTGCLSGRHADLRR